MRRVIIVALALSAAAAALPGAGCRDGGQAHNPQERFVLRMAKLQGQALQDTLRFLLDRPSPEGLYANYLLGNQFYGQATDSSRVKGWNDGDVNALLDSAEVYFGRAVARDSTFIEALVNLGSLWDDRAEQMSSREIRDERLAKAETYYKAALRTDANDEKARCNLGSLYLRQRRTQDALNEFKAVLEHDPQSALAHYNLAILFAEAKIYREALAEWELASKYDPEGDIGDRSRDNVKIVKDLMSAPTPDAVK